MFKDNKTPLSEKGQKKTETSLTGKNYDEAFENRFLLPKAIKDELDAKGLDHRFINYKKYIDEGHFHRGSWVPYKCTSITGKDQFGKDLDGHIRRGDTILAVRAKERTQEIKKFMDQKNARYRNFNKAAAEELRQRAREAGVPTKVYEGYEENE